jgi:hypothetical protein
MNTYNFDDIRSFRDHEVKSVLNELIKDPGFIYILKKIFTDQRIESLGNEFEGINSIFDFQSNYISGYVKALIRLSITKLNAEGLEQLDKNSAYLFISNHRDIILDSALINEMLFRNEFKTSEIAIGNNLLIYKWIEQLARLNKSFIVRRDLTGKEMLQESVKLSSYIRDSIIHRNTSVWIAQREGRTKDGNDQTDTALLKMINFSGKGSFDQDFSDLNIVPVSISYENEPALESKILATYTKLKGETYKKTLEDDLKDMGRGLYDMKGEVNIVFGKPINKDSIQSEKNKNENIGLLAQMINDEIHKNYVLTKNNYISFDILNHTNRCLNEGKYQKEDETKLKVQCKKIVSSSDGDFALVEKIFYGIYAGPLINKIDIP